MPNIIRSIGIQESIKVVTSQLYSWDKNKVTPSAIKESPMEIEPTRHFLIISSPSLSF